MGRRLAGNGARFGFQVPAPPRGAKLMAPPPGGETPWNLGVVRAFAEAGRLSLIRAGGREVSSGEGASTLGRRVQDALGAGEGYAVSLDGVSGPDQRFPSAGLA